MGKVICRNGSYQPVNSEFKIIDAITIDLCTSVFPRAAFLARKGAFKLHTVLADMLPGYVIFADGKPHDRAVVKKLQFKPGDLLIFARAYLDYAWLYGLHQRGVWFLTQLKINSCYKVVDSQAITTSH